MKELSKLNSDNAELLLYETDQMYITILGGIKLTGLDKLRVTLKMESKSNGTLPIRQSLDLYYAKQVDHLVNMVTDQMEFGTSAAQKLISDLTGELESYREERIEASKPKEKVSKELTAEELKLAKKYLTSKNLIENTKRDIERSGIVGKSNNPLIAKLIYQTRKLEKPLHVMFLGASGSGKTYTQENIGKLVPEEERIEITSLSDNAFYYFKRDELKYKLILIEDLDGAKNAMYPLRELQTKQALSKTVTIKDHKGIPRTVHILVEGPVCISGCTTWEKIYEDNANRCILLYIDDSKDQDQLVMEYQQKLSAGKINKEEESKIRDLLLNVDRLLQPIKVINPYAELINLPSEVFKPRRTQQLLLQFIEAITFYHQYQRKVKAGKETGEAYIESTVEDIEWAFKLMEDVLFSKSDELTKACRGFFERLKKSVKKGDSFYSKSIRKELRLSPSTLKRYLFMLVRYGYVKVSGGSKYKGYEYEIIDYEEYGALQGSIREQLDQILEKIKADQGEQ